MDSKTKTAFICFSTASAIFGALNHEVISKESIMAPHKLPNFEGYIELGLVFFIELSLHCGIRG